MRIALYHNLPSGGAKRTLSEQIMRLSKNHQVDLYCLNISEEEMFPIKGFCQNVHIFKVIDFRKYGLFKFLFKYLQLFQIIFLSPGIAKQIDQKNYDLVFLHPCQITQAPFVLNFLKTKSVYFAHEPFREAYESLKIKKSVKEALNDILLWFYKFLRKKIDRRSIEKAFLVLANSRFTQENLRKIYGISAKVCYPGVDLSKFKPLSLKRQSALLSVGRLTPQKAPDFVIEIISEIPSKQRPQLFIAADSGTKKDEEKLIRLAEEKKVELEIKKRVSEGELVKLYNKVLAVVCPQIREPFGLVPLEGMACKTPVVAVKEGGFLETIKEGETGLFFKREPKEAAKVILKLIKDKNLREKLVKNGLFEIKKWNWETSVEKLEKEMEKIL